MVNVAHDGDDRRTRFKVFVLVLDRIDHVFHVSVGDTDDLVAKFFDDQFSRILIDRLVLRDHHAHFHQLFDNVSHTFGHTVGQFRHHDGLGHLNVTNNLFARLIAAAHGFLAQAFLLPFHRRNRALATVATRQRLIQSQLARAAAIATLALAAVAVLVLTVAITTRRRLRTTAACACGTGLGGLGVCWRRCSFLGFGGFGRLGAFLVLGRSAAFRAQNGPFTLFSFALLGFGSLLALAFVLFGTLARSLGAITLFAFFCLDLFAATLAIFFAAALLVGTGFRLVGFAGLGGLQCLHAAFHLAVRNPRLAAFRLATLASARLTGTRLRHHNALALGFDHDILGPAVAKALLYLTRPRSAAQTQCFFAVAIAHMVFVPFAGDTPPSVVWRIA